VTHPPCVQNSWALALVPPLPALVVFDDTPTPACLPPASVYTKNTYYARFSILTSIRVARGFHLIPPVLGLPASLSRESLRSTRAEQLAKASEGVQGS
jgi:hypothetical protein